MVLQPAAAIGVGVAGGVRVGAAGGSVRGAGDGGGAGCGGAGDRGDMDNGGGAAGVLREAEEGSGGGREEDYQGDFGVRGEDPFEGRKCGGRRLRCFGLLCSGAAER
ncbi:hypothetical protein LINGRAHAP2_LOCUS28915 [Linum grandiflorum]